MPETPDEFAHGRYGDLSGVVFSATARGLTSRLPISDRFITPLFTTILTHRHVPRTVMEWNEDRGWVTADHAVALDPSEVHVLKEALFGVTRDAVAPLCHGCTPAECVRCAREIAVFLDAHVVDDYRCFIARD